MKTGSEGRPWVELEPKPARVLRVEVYWQSPPPNRSARCAYWLRQIEAGWRPNKRFYRGGYWERAEYLGVYIWEYFHVILPVLEETREETP